jgi:hypothetical protein
MASRLDATVATEEFAIGTQSGRIVLFDAVTEVVLWSSHCHTKEVGSLQCLIRLHGWNRYPFTCMQALNLLLYRCLTLPFRTTGSTSAQDHETRLLSFLPVPLVQRHK